METLLTKKHSSTASRREKRGMLMLYKEKDTGKDMVAVVGKRVPLHIYKQMPKYVRVNFKKPSKLESEKIIEHNEKATVKSYWEVKND